MNLPELFHELLELEQIFRELETRQTRGLTKLCKRGKNSLVKARDALDLKDYMEVVPYPLPETGTTE